MEENFHFLIPFHKLLEHNHDPTKLVSFHAFDTGIQRSMQQMQIM